MRCDNRRASALIIFLLITSFVRSSENQILVYKKKYIMGTVFEIAAYDQSSEHATHAIEKAFEQIVRLDDLMSNYKPDSALSNLNRSAHFHSERVPPDLYRVIDEALQFSKLSDGKFDISIAPLVNLWKAALRGEDTPSQARQEEARSCVGYEKVELTPPDKINFRSPCLRLDLGAIGKGYAVDRAAEVLSSMGIQQCLDQCRWQHDFRDGISSRSGGMARALERSLKQDRSAGHAQGCKCIHIGADSAQFSRERRSVAISLIQKQECP